MDIGINTFRCPLPGHSWLSQYPDTPDRESHYFVVCINPSTPRFSTRAVRSPGIGSSLPRPDRLPGRFEPHPGCYTGDAIPLVPPVGVTNPTPHAHRWWRSTHGQLNTCGNAHSNLELAPVRIEHTRKHILCGLASSSLPRFSATCSAGGAAHTPPQWSGGDSWSTSKTCRLWRCGCLTRWQLAPMVGPFVVNRQVLPGT